MGVGGGRTMGSKGRELAEGISEQRDKGQRKEGGKCPRVNKGR